jgi:hypothetical protein
MPGVEQFFSANGADITGAAGDKNVHADSVTNFRASERSKRKSGLAPGDATTVRNPAAVFLEPALFPGDVGGDKILVALGEVNDAFNETDDATDATGKDADDDLDDAFLCVAEYEFMNSQLPNRMPNMPHRIFLSAPGIFSLIVL